MSRKALTLLFTACLSAVVVAQQAGVRSEEIPAPILARCLSCHGFDLIEQQRLGRTAWERELDKMMRWGAVVPESERTPLLDALQQLSIRNRSSAAAAQEEDTARGAEVFEQRCLRCHRVDIVEQQRLTVAGWRREVDKMIGWGARIDDAEKGSLVAYLSERYGIR